MSESDHRIQVKVTEVGASPAVFEVAGPTVTIGRSKDCDVVLEQTYVSGRHVAIHYGVLAEDLGSSNGTFLGGSALSGPTLMAGKTITLGGHSLAVEVQAVDAGGPLGMLARQVTRLGDQTVGAGVAREALAVEFGSIGENSRLLSALVTHDIDGVEAPKTDGGDGSGVTDTFIYEAFAFIRNAERIIARVAGDVARRPSMHTQLPGSDVNFRAVMGRLFAERGNEDARRAVEEYLTQVLDWLFASVSAYQSAAIAVVQELQDEMRPGALMGLGEVSRVGRWLRREKVELWDRAQERLEEWTKSHIVERLGGIASSALSDDGQVR